MSLQLLAIEPADELRRVRAERMRRSFAAFARAAWSEVDPAPLVWNWHLDALCLHLQAVEEKRLQRLLINVPPGTAKSVFVSVLFPAWVWTRRPEWQVLTASYDQTLAYRDAVKSRKLLRSDWYRAHFLEGERAWDFSEDQNNKGLYENTRMGFRLAMSVAGGGTGKRGDSLIIDDAMDAGDAHNKEQREKVVKWKTETMSSRFNTMESATEIVIGQRLHEGDLPGYLASVGGWTHLCLPSRWEDTTAPNWPCKCEDCKRGHTGIGWSDPRKGRPGALLFPAKFPESVLQHAESPKGMGAIAFAGQHQQRPFPAAGGMIKREWLNKRWHLPGAKQVHEIAMLSTVRREYNPLTAKPLARFMTSDCAFKDTKDSDRVSIGVWDLVGADLYRIDGLWGRMGFLETCDGIQSLRTKWSRGRVKVGRVCIEDKANGPAVIEVLKTKVPGIVPIAPQGSKEARVAAASPFMHAGNVWLAEHDPQTPDMVNEACAFPQGSNDDWIDETAYAVILALLGSDVTRLKGLVKW